MFISPPVTATPAAASVGKIICIIITFVVGVFVAIGVVAIALGVGLGVSLRNNDSSNSGSTSTTGTTLSSQTAASTARSTTASTTASSTASSTTAVTTSCSTCGCSPKNITAVLGRVINGVTATANSWPWMVYLSINSRSLCGGFLIGYQHVVTAAHCVTSPATDIVYVYAGLQKRSAATINDRRLVSAIRAHPNYNPVNFDNDIAVLKLTSSFTPSAKIGTCCLPTVAASLPTVGQKALVMGWGTTIDGVSSSTSDDLKEAVVQIQDTSATCTVSTIKFCAGLGTTDTCQGDSGGPLLTSVNNQWTCTGVVSSGVGCRGYGSYTRVSAFRSFIDNAVQTL
jgi:secreted trypsin-like serine protease